MIGAPNSLNLNCKVRVMKEASGPSVSEEIVDIFRNYNIDNVLVLDNIVVEKTCLCLKCEIASLFLNFSHINESYMIGYIHRHPNGIVNHIVKDLENTLIKFDDKTTIIFIFLLTQVTRIPT